MKKLKFDMIFLFFFISVFSIIFIPNLFIKWMLIDDGYTIFFVKSLHTSITDFNFIKATGSLMEATGRIRPVYWIFNYIVWFIGGTDPFIHRVAHVLVWSGIIYFIYKILTRLTKIKALVYIVLVIFILSPINFENILRIGPQEPLSLILMLSGIYFIMKSKTRLSIISFVLSMLTKETSLAIIPGLLFLLIWHGKVKLELKNIKKVFVIVSAVSVFIALNYLLNSQKGYVASYEVNLSTMIANTVANIKIIYESAGFIAISTLLLLIFNTFVKPKNVGIGKYYSYFFLITFFSMILVQAPWEYVLPRYLTPAFTFLILAFTTEMSVLLSRIKISNALFKNTALLIIFILFVAYSFSRLLNLFHSTTRLVYETRLIDHTTSFIAKNAKQNGEVFVNLTESLSTQEPVYEIGVHLALFKNRDDLKVKYLKEENMVNGVIIDANLGKKLYETDQLVKKYPEKEIKTITVEGSIPVFTTPDGFIKESIKKAYRLIRYGTKLDLEGIYTTHFYKIDWNILI